MYRTSLYVAADRIDRLDKALSSGADSVIADLEDAVAPDRRRDARAGLVDWLAREAPSGSAAAPDVWVRINPGQLGVLDAAALADLPRVRGLCLAKTRSRDDVDRVAAILDRAGSAAVLSPLLEDAEGVLAAREIAAGPRVVRLQLGEADLRAQLAIVASASGAELLYLRSHVVLISAAAGLGPPLGPVSTDFRNLDALADGCHALRRLGFFGRACIHPTQVPVVNMAFTPSPSEVDHARGVIADYTGAAHASDGEMVDEAVVRSARRIVELADTLASKRLRT